jgi:hypothetical protein
MSYLFPPFICVVDARSHERLTYKFGKKLVRFDGSLSGFAPHSGDNCPLLSRVPVRLKVVDHVHGNAKTKLLRRPFNLPADGVPPANPV